MVETQSETSLAVPGNVPRVDAEALFKKLGLQPADARPIMEGWRQANAQWRRDHLRRMAAHAQRIGQTLAASPQDKVVAPIAARAGTGRRRAVWCVELRRRFGTLTEAAAFVDRKASNISQSLTRGVRCGAYHWEVYDEAKHAARKDE